jgi:hypothetical protein
MASRHLEDRLGSDLLEQGFARKAHQRSGWLPFLQPLVTIYGNDPAGIRTRVCAVRGHRPDH